MLKQIAKSPGKSSLFSNSRKNKDPTHVLLPTLFSNEKAKIIIVPLGYQGSVKPDQNKECDLPGCKTSSNDEWIILHGCFHSFHVSCLNDCTFCPLCKDFLQQKIKELGTTAKEAILKPSSRQNNINNNDNQDSSEDTTTESTTLIQETAGCEIDNIVESLNAELAQIHPPQPSMLQPLSTPSSNSHPVSTGNSQRNPRTPPHCKTCGHAVRGHKRGNFQTKCSFCPNAICASHNNSRCTCDWHLRHTPFTQRQSGNITEWVLPNHISQSTIGGRVGGSNACTVISLLTGLDILNGTLLIPTQQSDLPDTIATYSNLIKLGNNIYDTYQLPLNQPNLDVREVLQRDHTNFEHLELKADWILHYPGSERLSVSLSSSSSILCCSSYSST